MFKSKEEKLALKVARKERRAEKLAKAEAEMARLEAELKAEMKKTEDNPIISRLSQKADRLSQEASHLSEEADRLSQKAKDEFKEEMAKAKVEFKKDMQEAKDGLKEVLQDTRNAFSEFKTDMKSVKGDFKKISSDMKTMTAFDATRLRYPKMTDDEKSAFETEARAFLSNRFDLEYADLYLELIHVENDPNSTMDDINPLRKRLKEMRKADVQAHKNSSKD